MTEKEIRAILMRFLPGATVLFLSRDGERMVLAVDGPADTVINIYQRAGYSVEARAGLKKAS